MEKSQIHYSVIFLFATKLREYQFSSETDKNCDETREITIFLQKPNVELTYGGNVEENLVLQVHLLYLLAYRLHPSKVGIM